MAQRRPFSEVLNDTLQEILDNVDENEFTFTKERRNLVSICSESEDDNVDLIFYNEGDKMLYFVDLKALKAGGDNPVRQLICEPSLPNSFEILEVKMNPTGTAAALRGRGSVRFISIPSDRSSVEQGEKYPLWRCRSSLVGENFELSSMTTITKMEWHPLSAVHLVVLTSDNMLRIYNLSHDTRSPEQTIPLITPTRHGLINKVTSFTIPSPRMNDWATFSIFFTTGSEICYLCPVVPFRCLIHKDLISSLIPEDEPQNVISRYFDSLHNEIMKDDSFFLTQPHRSHQFHSATPTPMPLKILFTDKQLSNYVKNIVDLELIESDLLSVIVVTERAQVCSFLTMQSLQPYWLEGNNGLELIAVDVVDLSMDRRISKQLTYLIKHPIASETIYCAHACGLHSLQYPFLVNISADRELEYESCISRHLINTANTKEQYIPSVSFLSDINFGVMCVALIKNRFVVLNIIAEMFSKDKNPNETIDSKRPTEKTDFEKIIDKEWKKSQIDVPVMVNWVELNERDNLELLRSVVTQFKESGYTFCKNVNIAIQEKLQQLDKHRREQEENLRSLQHRIRNNETKFEEQMQKIDRLLNEQAKINDRAEKIQDKVQRMKPQTIAEQRFSNTVEYWSIEVNNLKLKIQQLESKQNNVLQKTKKSGVFSQKQTQQITDYMAKTFEQIQTAISLIDDLENRLKQDEDIKQQQQQQQQQEEEEEEVDSSLVVASTPLPQRRKNQSGSLL
jgi:hypothetical protein